MIIFTLTIGGNEIIIPILILLGVFFVSALFYALFYDEKPKKHACEITEKYYYMSTVTLDSYDFYSRLNELKRMVEEYECTINLKKITPEHAYLLHAITEHFKINIKKGLSSLDCTDFNTERIESLIQKGETLYKDLKSKEDIFKKEYAMSFLTANINKITDENTKRN